METQGLQLLQEVQALEFALYELHLYLDTHPGDETALVTFKNLQSRYAEVRRAYEEQVAPLVSSSPSSWSQGRWRWVEEPWPWEIEY